MFYSYFHSFVFIAFLWGTVAFVRVQCRSTAGIPEESKSSGQMELCLMKCGINVRTDVRGISTEESSRRRRSCYDECLIREGNLRSHMNKQNLLVDQQMKPSFIRIKRAETSISEQFGPEKADKCFPGNATDGATPFTPENITLTFKELNSSGRYKGEVSWTPLRDDFNWTGYRIIYGLIDFTKQVTKCQDLGKNVTNYTIANYPYGLMSDVTVTILVTSLPYAAGRDMLITCDVPENCSHYSKDYQTTQTTDVKRRSSISTLGDDKQNTITVVVIVVAVVSVCVIAAVLLVFRYYRRSQRLKSLRRSSSSSGVEFAYDAFVIFSSGDEDWVVKTLIPTLEEKHGFKCCVHYRDFTPGVPIRQNMVDSVYKCKKTVAVVSTHFFNSNYCGSELDYALHRLMEKKDDSLVVIKLDDVDRMKLPKELQKRSYIDYPKSVEKETWEKKLVNCLKVSGYPSNE